MTFDSYEAVLYTILFVLPGFVMNMAYSMMFPQRNLESQTSILKYLFFSCLNYIFWAVFIYDWIQDKYWENHPIRWLFILFMIVIVTPYILGTLFGFVTRKEWIRKLYTKMNFDSMHPVPTGWDYIFDRGGYVLVTLKSGEKYHGKYGSNSLASSVPEERDIYIEVIYDVDNDGVWTEKVRSAGIWIPKDEIQTIEFYSLSGGESNE